MTSCWLPLIILSQNSLFKYENFRLFRKFEKSKTMLGIPPFAITILLKRLDYSILFSIFTQVSQVVYVRAKSFFPSYRRAVRNNVYGNIPYGAMKETTFTATFRMEQRKKQRLRQHSVWSKERNNVYGNIPYGAMKETTFTATVRMEQ